VPGDVSVASADGGGAGGAGVEGCVCTSSRATVEDEKKRRGVPLVVGSCRTHRRQILTFRAEDVTDAMADDRWDAGAGADESWYENVGERQAPRIASNLRNKVRNF